MISNPPQNVSASAAIAKLPLDIIHCLLDFTTIVDLLHFCSTCQALCQHTDTKNDSIWKRACAFYGLRDFTHFRGLSPYTIYTQLLHSYGPLLGLWASDYPYLGTILEFRLCSGSVNEQGGIVGEIWSFPRPPESPNDPLPPSYVRTLKISFETCPDAPPSGATSGSPLYSSTTPPVDVDAIGLACWGSAGIGKTEGSTRAGASGRSVTSSKEERAVSLRRKYQLYRT